MSAQPEPDNFDPNEALLRIKNALIPRDPAPEVVVPMPKVSKAAPFDPRSLLPAVMPEVDLVFCTPELAQQILSRNVLNRKEKPWITADYLRQMMAGEWECMGVAVMIDTNHIVVNGQHTLLAIVEGGKQGLPGVWLRIETGCAPRTRGVVDTGIRRSTGDNLTIEGFPYPTILGPSAKWLINFEHGRLHMSNTARALHDTEVIAFIQENPGLVQAAGQASSLRRWIDLNTSALASTIFLTSQKSPSASVEFFTHLADGTSSGKGSPITALRRRLHVLKHGDKKINDTAAEMSVTIRAWNDWRKNPPRQVSNYQMTSGGQTIPCPKPI